MSSDPTPPVETDVAKATIRWVPTLSTFAARLASVRHEMGWNAKEAALACGLPAASWREWELNGREPRGLQKIVEQISDRTGVDEYWLLTGKGIPDPVPPAGFEPAAFRSEDPLVFPQVDQDHGIEVEDHDWLAPVVPIGSTVATN